MLTYIGRHTLAFCDSCGRYIIFLYNVFINGLRPPYYWKQMMCQLMDVGFCSLPVIGLTSIFTGAVLALQSYTGFSRFSAESALPMLVVLCITRELGPVIAGLMFAGRVGATMAAEIGTMKVMEQIDALSTLSTCCYRFLYWPRILAGLLTLPLLVFICDIIGVFGGFLVSVYQLDFNAVQYIKMTVQFLQAEDIISGLIKAAFFGLSTALTGCFQGACSLGGAAGVGHATRNTVVMSSITIFFLNYLLTTIIFSK
ncbi:MAG: ABC transporter permease [Holosporales bacterium]|nr:ABC transporter permease [Holosporales bacterium]